MSELIGYGLLVFAPLQLVSSLLTWNLWRWFVGIAAFPCLILIAFVALAIGNVPEPTSQEIAWYVYGTASLIGLMLLSRFCTWLLGVFA